MRNTEKKPIDPLSVSGLPAPEPDERIVYRQKVSVYEELRTESREQRENAEELRDIHRTATCGHDLRYGTKTVYGSTAARVAAMYLIWADEADGFAESLEQQMENLFVPPAPTADLPVDQ